MLVQGLQTHFFVPTQAWAPAQVVAVSQGRGVRTTATGTARSPAPTPWALPTTPGTPRGPCIHSIAGQSACRSGPAQQPNTPSQFAGCLSGGLRPLHDNCGEPAYGHQDKVGSQFSTEVPESVVFQSQDSDNDQAPSGWQPAISALDQETIQDHRRVWQKIDSQQTGSVTKLGFLAAAIRSQEVMDLIMGGVPRDEILEDEDVFYRVYSLFDAIVPGHQESLTFKHFSTFLRKAADAEQHRREQSHLALFNLLGPDENREVSALEFFTAVQSEKKVAESLLPGVNPSGLMEDEAMFAHVDALFKAISGGRNSFNLEQFQLFMRKAQQIAPTPSRSRAETRVMIIGPGFGARQNPAQGRCIERAGYKVHWCHALPKNPEVAGFDINAHIGQLKKELQSFRPHVLVSGSKGALYALALWAANLWRGPSVQINGHPSLVQIPEDMSVVLCHGSNDSLYPRLRGDLEEVVKTGSVNRCLLYYTANSGQLPGGQFSRRGDVHNMDSLIQHECLPRLIDSTLSLDGPQVHLMRTWRELLPTSRVEAEEWLGQSPEALRRFWKTTGHQEEALIQVNCGSKEFQMIEAVFRAVPKDTPSHTQQHLAQWSRQRILQIDRVENASQRESCTQYMENVKRSLAEQEMDFDPNIHMCWAFHGCGADDLAMESIVANPISGLQPLASGSRGASVWGRGSYFARDAKYVCDGGFCGLHAGARRMLMCLLTLGNSCLGDPENQGLLPFRYKNHRFNSAVDYLSFPEVYITQHPAAAMLAYVVTFGS